MRGSDSGASPVDDQCTRGAKTEGQQVGGKGTSGTELRPHLADLVGAQVGVGRAAIRLLHGSHCAMHCGDPQWSILAGLVSGAADHAVCNAKIEPPRSELVEIPCSTDLMRPHGIARGCCSSS